MNLTDRKPNKQPNHYYSRTKRKHINSQLDMIQDTYERSIGKKQITPNLYSQTLNKTTRGWLNSSQHNASPDKQIVRTSNRGMVERLPIKQSTKEILQKYTQSERVSEAVEDESEKIQDQNTFQQKTFLNRTDSKESKPANHMLFFRKNKQRIKLHLEENAKKFYQEMMGQTSKAKTVTNQNRDNIVEHLKADAIEQTINLGIKATKGDDHKFNNQEEFAVIKTDNKPSKLQYPPPNIKQSSIVQERPQAIDQASTKPWKTIMPKYPIVRQQSFEKKTSKDINDSSAIQKKEQLKNENLKPAPSTQKLPVPAITEPKQKDWRQLAEESKPAKTSNYYQQLHRKTDHQDSIIDEILEIPMTSKNTTTNKQRKDSQQIKRDIRSTPRDLNQIQPTSKIQTFKQSESIQPTPPSFKEKAIKSPRNMGPTVNPQPATKKPQYQQKKVIETFDDELQQISLAPPPLMSKPIQAKISEPVKSTQKQKRINQPLPRKNNSPTLKPVIQQKNQYSQPQPQPTIQQKKRPQPVNQLKPLTADQIDQYIDNIFKHQDMINLLGEYVKRAKTVYDKVNFNWCVVGYNLYRKFAFEREKMKKCLVNKQNCFNLKGMQVPDRALNECLNNQQVQKLKDEFVDQSKKVQQQLNLHYQKASAVDKSVSKPNQGDPYLDAKKSLAAEYRFVTSQTAGKSNKSMMKRLVYLTELLFVLQLLNGRYIKDYEQEKQIKNTQAYLNIYTKIQHTID